LTKLSPTVQKNTKSKHGTTKHSLHAQKGGNNDVRWRMSSMQTSHSTELADERNLVMTRTCDKDCSRPGYY